MTLDKLQTSFVPVKEFVVPENVTIPLTDGSIDKVKKQEWINMHPDELMPMAQYMADHIVYVDFSSFVSELVKVTDEVGENIGDKKYIIVRLTEAGEEKSDVWVNSIIEKRTKPPEAIISPEQVGEYLDNNSDVTELEYRDDAVFSGIQMRDSMLKQMLADEKFKRISKERQINLHIDVPFISQRFLERYSKEKLEEMGCKIDMVIPKTASIMLTLGGMLDLEEDREKAEMIRAQVSKIQGEQGLKHETTYFQHKAADYLSFNVDLLQGLVADSRGGYMPWKVKFIPEIMAPYKTGYLEWVNVQRQKIEKENNLKLETTMPSGSTSDQGWMDDL